MTAAVLALKATHGVATSFEYPPIPVRTLDWMAHYADDDEDPEYPMPKGWGATELDAINDLLENHPR